MVCETGKREKVEGLGWVAGGKVRGRSNLEWVVGIEVFAGGDGIEVVGGAEMMGWWDGCLGGGGDW